MKALVIGAGGVGRAIVNIASRKSFISQMVVADRTLSRAEEAVTRVNDSRFSAAEVNAAELEDIRALIRKVKPDVVVNAVDPRLLCQFSWPAKLKIPITSIWRCHFHGLTLIIQTLKPA